MKKYAILLTIFVFSVGIAYSYGQCDCTSKSMINTIDSIAKANNIEIGLVLHYRITSIGESTITNITRLSEKQKFAFEKSFLVMGATYYNMDKLIFFKVQEDSIEFYFQTY